jgi:hypothetical protein
MKNPNITALNRLMGRGKALVANYLSDKTGLSFKPSTYKKEYPTTVNFHWYTNLDQRADGSPEVWVRHSIEIHVAWMSNTGRYNVNTQAYKGSRSIGANLIEGLTLEDFRDPSRYISQVVLEDVQKSLKGDYSKELRLIKDTAEELIETARKNLKAAELIADLAMGEPIANVDAIACRKYDIKDCQYSVDLILQLIRVIKRKE